MKSQTLPSTLLLPKSKSVLREILLASPLDEISNVPGCVRRHIFNHGDRDRKNNGTVTRDSLMFFVYQTGRHGPQNGFRLVVVHRGYYVGTSPEKGVGKEEEDDIDRIEKPIPQGHVEVVILGDVPEDVVLTDDEIDGGGGCF